MSPSYSSGIPFNIIYQRRIATQTLLRRSALSSLRLLVHAVQKRNRCSSIPRQSQLPFRAFLVLLGLSRTSASRYAHQIIAGGWAVLRIVHATCINPLCRCIEVYSVYERVPLLASTRIRHFWGFPIRVNTDLEDTRH